MTAFNTVHSISTKTIAFTHSTFNQDAYNAHRTCQTAVLFGYTESDAVRFSHLLRSELSGYLANDPSNEQTAILLFCADDAAEWLLSH